MKKRNISNDEFIKKVYDLIGNEYVFLEKYIKSSIKLKVRHTKCGYEYMVTPGNFFSGRRCPKCAGYLRKTTEEFKKEVFSLVGNEYSVISEYKSAITDIEMKHNECGLHYKVRPNNFLNGQRCPICCKFKRPLKSKEFIDEDLKYFTKGQFELVGEYKRSDVKTEFKHVCGHVFLIMPSYLLRNPVCPKCKEK